MADESGMVQDNADVSGMAGAGADRDGSVKENGGDQPARPSAGNGAGKSPSVVRSDDGDSGAAAGSGALSILMVDDDPTILRMFESFLGKKGYVFNSLRDPRAIMNSIKVHKPDIIFMDIMLKNVRGDGVIRLLRKKGICTPVIVISSNIDKKTVVGLKDQGVVDFILKPVSIKKLMAAIKRAKEYRPESAPSSCGDDYAPVILLLSGNKKLAADPLALLPRTVIEEHDAEVLSAPGFREALSLIKSHGKRITIVVVDATSDAEVVALTKLLVVIEKTLKLPVCFMAQTVPSTVKHTFSAMGFSNFISMSQAKQEDVEKLFDTALLNGARQPTPPTPVIPKRFNIMQQLKDVKNLPPLPDIYLKVENLAQNPRATSSDYARVLELDPAITARLLRMSNSALFSFKRKIKTVKDAVALMGVREILSLVRMACITGGMKSNPDVLAAVRNVWKHSALTASAAVVLYEKGKLFTTPGLEDDLFICGIIHDLGKIALWNLQPELYLSFILNGEVDVYPRVQDEERFLGVSHCAVGRVLAEHWQLPPMFVDVIAGHHNPLMQDGQDLVGIVHIANFMSAYIEGLVDGPDENLLNSGYLASIDISTDDVIGLTGKLAQPIKDKASIIYKLIAV